jgi:hypothetical protein
MVTSPWRWLVATERRLVRWLATHHHGEIIRGPEETAKNQPEDLRIVAACEEGREQECRSENAAPTGTEAQ